MIGARKPRLTCDGLTVTVTGRTLVQDLSFELTGGEILAVLGRNGAGKSLTLHTLAGLRPAESGYVLFDGQDITENRQYITRHLALLPQYTDDPFPSTVLDTALIGRHPHIARLQWESIEDRRITVDALRSMDLDEMSSREVASLSGGERRRLAIAQVLTQTPQIYLLDEPTNHLDPQHQLDVLDVFTRNAKDGAGVIASLHDVNLAARYADRCLLLFGDGRWELDQTSSALTEDRLSELYNTSMEVISWRGRRLFVANSKSAS